MQKLSIHINQPLADFTLDINTNISLQGVTAIYGPSGSGKTSLLRAIAGLNKQAKGDIALGEHYWQQGTKHLPTHKRRIAYVFQEAGLFKHLNVNKNLAYSQQRSGQMHTSDDNAEYRQHIVQTLNIAHLLERSIQTLSGGEKQRVAIARALLNRPQILLMDEPLSALDDASRQSILQYLTELKAVLNIPIIYVSHSLSEISQIADQLLWIKQGKIIAQDKALPLIHRIQQESLSSHQQALFTVVDAKLSGHLQQISTVNVNGTELFIHTLDNNATDNNLRFILRAKDISITLHKSNDSSILNILPATITAINAPHNHTQIIHLNCGGFQCFAQLTQHSCLRLNLKEGMNVFAQIKAVSLLS